MLIYLFTFIYLFDNLNELKFIIEINIYKKKKINNYLTFFVINYFYNK